VSCKNRFLAAASLLLLLSAASVTATGLPQNTQQRDAAYTQLRAAKLSGEAVSVKDLTIHRDAATFVFNRRRRWISTTIRRWTGSLTNSSMEPRFLDARSISN